MGACLVTLSAFPSLREEKLVPVNTCHEKNATGKGSDGKIWILYKIKIKGLCQVILLTPPLPPGHH